MTYLHTSSLVLVECWYMCEQNFESISFCLQNDQSSLATRHNTLVTFLVLLDVNFQSSTYMTILILRESRG
jgi:hypothetical protein